MVGKPIDKGVYSIEFSPCYEYIISSSSECISFTHHTHAQAHTYIHGISFNNPYKPLGFGYETCLKDLTNSNRYTQNKMYTHTIKILKW